MKSFISMLLLVLTVLVVMVSCSNVTNPPSVSSDSLATSSDVSGVVTSDSEETTMSEQEREELKATVDEILSSKHKLTFNDDGSFRVLILADIHMTYGSSAGIEKNIKERIKTLIDKENPNLVIFTGDNTISSSSEAKLKSNITAFVEYIESQKIPWCHVYGNHDDEYGALSKEKQQEIYESFEYCISKDVEELSGVGNYVHGIFNQDGSLGAVIYLLDSGTYAATGGYDYIKLDQISWYKDTSELLQKYNGGEVVPGLMAFHIPLIENKYADLAKDNDRLVSEYTGSRNENICSSNTDTNLFETVIKRKDVKAIVTGHDHVNDYMYNYRGVKLASCSNFSEYTYTSRAVQGARVFDMNLSTIDNIPTYMSYLYEGTDETHEHRTHESSPTPDASELSDILGDRISLYLPLDETIEDVIGKKTTEEKGTLTYTDGYFGKAAKFDNGYITIPGYAPAKDSFSVCFWMKTSGVSSDPVILSNKDWVSGVNKGYVLSLRAYDFHFNAGNGGGRVDVKPALPVDFADGWVYVVLVVDREAGVVRFSFDFEAFEESSLESLKDASFNAFDNLNIGQDGTGNYGKKLTATLDEFVMINGVLTDADLAALATRYGVN